VNSLYPSVLASQILIMSDLSPIQFYGVDEMSEKTYSLCAIVRQRLGFVLESSNIFQPYASQSSSIKITRGFFHSSKKTANKNKTYLHIIQNLDASRMMFDDSEKVPLLGSKSWDLFSVWTKNFLNQANL